MDDRQKGIQSCLNPKEIIKLMQNRKALILDSETTAFSSANFPSKLGLSHFSLEWNNKPVKVWGSKIKFFKKRQKNPIGIFDNGHTTLKVPVPV